MNFHLTYKQEISLPLHLYYVLVVKRSRFHHQVWNYNSNVLSLQFYERTELQPLQHFNKVIITAKSSLLLFNSFKFRCNFFKPLCKTYLLHTLLLHTPVLHFIPGFEEIFCWYNTFLPGCRLRNNPWNENSSNNSIQSWHTHIMTLQLTTCLKCKNNPQFLLWILLRVKLQQWLCILSNIQYKLNFTFSYKLCKVFMSPTVTSSLYQSVQHTDSN